MGQLLQEAGLISEGQLQGALEEQRQTRTRLGEVLVQQGLITEERLLHFLGQQFGLPTLSSLPEPSNLQLAQVVSEEWARSHLMVPVDLIGRRLTVALVDPTNMGYLDDVRFQTGCRIVPKVALASQVLGHINSLYQRTVPSSEKGCPPPSSSHPGEPPGEASGMPISTESTRHLSSHSTSVSVLDSVEFASLLERASSSITSTVSSVHDPSLSDVCAPLVQLVHRLVTRAAEAGASDVHIEPYEQFVRVRFRLDGVLHTEMTYPLRLRNAVISRLKILAHLDIAERRLPQDGRITLDVGQAQPLDVRVSFLPALHGENVVLRLLDQSGLALDLPTLGFDDAGLTQLLSALERSDGMILVTGPTGSGKTTTLYSALQILNSPDVNIVTVEDPVEYNFTGITQVQVKEDIGLGFSTVLRSFLRQDPDIIMVGEIRDRDTAQIAVKAALTGHRVLSTLHTTDAVRTVTRLLDMGVEPFMVASSIRLVVAQRLVRRICGDCQQPDPVPISYLRRAGFTEVDAEGVIPLRGRGCEVCHHTGYKGRIGLFEVLPISEDLQSLILQVPSADALKRHALREGLVSLRQNGLKKVKAGLTTLDEIATMSGD